MAIGLQKKWEQGKAVQPPKDDATPAPASKAASNPMGVAVGMNDELMQLRRDLKDARDRAVRIIDPARARPSKFMNRHALSFDRPEYKELVESIRASGGNEQPAMVRPMKGDRDHDFEIIAGLRRHRAAIDTGTPFKVIVEEADDEKTYELMTRENSQRADLTPWEWGRFYVQGLSLYGCTQKELSERVGMSEPHVVRSLAVGRLPDSLLIAFATPLDIQLRWGQPLEKLLETAEAKLLKAAGELAAERARALDEGRAPDAPGEVYRRLVGATTRGRPKAVGAKPRALQIGKVKGTLGVRGRVTRLELKTELTGEQLDKLEVFVRELVAGK